MKISIIVPVFNLETYISKLIESVLVQTYTDYELILVDDGSSDGSAEIIKSYVENDDRIIYICQENQGPGAARNTGLRASNGEYIMFFDGDDFLTRDDALEFLAQKTENEFDILVYPIQHASNEDLIVRNSEIRYTDSFNDGDSFVNTLFLMLKKGLILSSPCEQMFSRKYLLSNNLFFPEGVFSEDIEWIIRILKTEPNMNFTDFQFYCYRWNRPGSTCNTMKKNMEKQRKIIGFINSYYHELKSQDDILSQYILAYLAYHWCVQTSIIAILDEKEAQKEGYELLGKSKDILKFDTMKKVKIFHYCSLLIGWKNTAKLGAVRYNIKRRIVR